MTHLPQMMLDELQRRNYSQSTVVRIYVVEDFAKPANGNFIPVGFPGEVQEISVCSKSNQANSPEVLLGEMCC